MHVRVRFYRFAIEPKDGHAFPAPIDSVEVNDCHSMDEALLQAIKEFEHSHNLARWQEGADYYGFS